MTLAVRTAALEVRAIARTTIAVHSKSFALASRILGPRLRDQVAILYTWCRRADDAIDLPGPGDAGDAGTTIARLTRELALAYGGDATDPVLAAFGALAHERAIPRSYPAAVIDGLAMDAAGMRYRTMDELFTYCWRVAGVVGLMLGHVFGVRDDRALGSAADLGIAMQLTNVCRDVAEDWQRGRLYLPDELLARHGAAGLADELGPRRALPISARRPLAAAVRELLAIADRYYRSGDRGIWALPLRAGLAVSAARRVYAAIGDRLARHGHDVTAGRAIVSPGRKRVLIARAALGALAAAPVRAFAARPQIPTHTLERGDVVQL